MASVNCACLHQGKVTLHVQWKGRQGEGNFLLRRRGFWVVLKSTQNVGLAYAYEMCFPHLLPNTLLLRDTGWHLDSSSHCRYLGTFPGEFWKYRFTGCAPNQQNQTVHEEGPRNLHFCRSFSSDLDRVGLKGGIQVQDGGREHLCPMLKNSLYRQWVYLAVSAPIIGYTFCLCFLDAWCVSGIIPLFLGLWSILCAHIYVLDAETQ